MAAVPSWWVGGEETREWGSDKGDGVGGVVRAVGISQLDMDRVEVLEAVVQPRKL
jgi:hypothetical protein